MAHWSEIFEYTKYRNLQTALMYESDQEGPEKTRRTDQHYRETKSERKLFKLTMLFTIYLMYSDDGKLTFKERFFLKRQLSKNAHMLDINDKNAIKRWIQTGTEFTMMTQYIRQYKYNWDMVQFVLNAFKRINDDGKYTMVIDETKEKLLPFKDLLSANDI